MAKKAAKKGATKAEVVKYVKGKGATLPHGYEVKKAKKKK